MGDEDRSLLVNTTGHFMSVLLPNGSWRPLHGDPWMGGNLLWTATGAVLVDFEAACLGPVEWDWSSLPAEVAPLDINGGLLAELRVMRSLVVAAWCFAQQGRAPEVDGAARHHLAIVRTARTQP